MRCSSPAMPASTPAMPMPLSATGVPEGWWVPEQPWPGAAPGGWSTPTCYPRAARATKVVAGVAALPVLGVFAGAVLAAALAAEPGTGEWAQLGQAIMAVVAVGLAIVGVVGAVLVGLLLRAARRLASGAPHAYPSATNTFVAIEVLVGFGAVGLLSVGAYALPIVAAGVALIAWPHLTLRNEHANP